MADMLGADEVFLTNAIKGIKWVRRFHNTEYDNNITRKLASEVR
jgi:branched-subunit amino acid aminotransferase/4-amino-4-deoxychorismate lyase